MTNRITKPAIGLLLGLAMLLGLFAQPATASQKIPVNLRVVTDQNRIVFDQTVRTGTANVRPNSACPTLNGRTGPARTVTGATGIGLLYQAGLQFRALRPLRISDSDFGFGVCGIGGTMAAGEGWWVLRHNYKDASTGAEGLELKRNDSVLFYYSKSWQDPTPDSLFLNAPKQVRRGANVRVRAFKYTGAGTRSPAAGVRVFGGANPVVTNARGVARVRINRRTRLVARQGGLIPSNRVPVTLRHQRKR